MTQNNVVNIEIPYEYVTGGACRSEMLLNDEFPDSTFIFPNDYDLYFSDKSIFMNALDILVNSPLIECIKSESLISYMGTKCIHSEWCYKTISSKIIYDCFFFDLSEYELTNFIKNKHDFTVNACYQKKGSSIEILPNTEQHFKDKILVLNNHGTSLGHIVTKCKRFVKEGWTIDPNIVAWMITEMEDILKDTINNTNSGYITVINDGYGNTYKVKKECMFSDVFSLINDENLTLCFFSDNNEILKYAKNESNRRIIKYSNKSLFSKIKNFYLHKWRKS